ncbi:hypothetical protein RD792_005716 [Penstemon davidsonii]|uniref:COBRA-like protein n=1 Tax=Penstemon davidsonii TaxID=160366 RepID=A0ABR0DFL6_9LAMI|nr:hypothetical protein RD792_005716 [Penstemon davidsonii]
MVLIGDGTHGRRAVRVWEGHKRSLNVVVLIFLLFCFVSATYGYDPLDPNGNITIRWDVLLENQDSSQDVRISIVNEQLFRHVELPGWKLSWAWVGDEVIWNIAGAEATEQGNCSAFKGRQLPHCCLKEPTIIDLLPGAPYNVQVANCCKGGVLSSMVQDPVNHLAVFQMHIGSGGSNSNKSGNINTGMPANFSLGLRGYTCGDPVQVLPTKFYEDHGRRKTQALATWNVTCIYSQFKSSTAPTCCVSLSAFYNETIVPCPKCSCACNGQAGTEECVKPGELPPTQQQLSPHNDPPKPVVQCSDFMCPVKVHWHVKQSYKEYWRVKITVTNLNYVKNYSEWNLVVLHPNLSNVTQVFSFNYKPLNIYGNMSKHIFFTDVLLSVKFFQATKQCGVATPIEVYFSDDTGMFYGIDHYNDMLLQAGETGNVQTEMLMHKDVGIFTFKEGWAFPRKISFNGDDCVMPSPDMYPRLPNTAHFHAPPPSFFIVFTMLLLIFSFLNL